MSVSPQVIVGRTAAGTQTAHCTGQAIRCIKVGKGARLTADRAEKAPGGLSALPAKGMLTHIQCSPTGPR